VEDLSFSGFCYGSFGWLAHGIMRLYGDLDRNLQEADIRIYPEAYASIVGFLVFLSTILSVIGAFFLFFVLELLPIFPYIFIFPFVPLIVLAMGVIYPKSKASSRTQSFDSEVPYAAAYTTVMATGGISPYISIQRLKDAPLLPNLSKMAKILDIDVRGLGLDPVSAIEKNAVSVPSKDYRELLLGYASTLRSGGDVTHYLLRRTEVMFKDRLTKVKVVAERAASFVEIYATFAILLALGLYSIFIVSLTLQDYLATPLFTESVFILFGYILLPMISIIFLWLMDVSQPKFPGQDLRVYKVFATCIPLLIFLAVGMFFPFITAFSFLRYIPPFSLTSQLVSFIARNVMNLELGFEPAIGLCLAMIIGTLPVAITDIKITNEEKGVEFGVTNFMRDLVEVRKSGLSPEKCIRNLSKRNYGRLSKHLVVISRQLGWGFSFKEIFETFDKRVKSWLAKINMFLLVDAIHVGGGTPETLETLAEFCEMNMSMEKEKRMQLRPLMIIPYIGAGILIVFSVIFLTYARSVLGIAGKTLSFAYFAQLIMPPLIFHVYLMGLVAGKISSERVSAGFKHSLYLSIFSLLTFFCVPYVGMSFKFG
jgi:flagellar protein FlaJ